MKLDIVDKFYILGQISLGRMDENLLNSDDDEIGDVNKLKLYKVSH